MELRGITLLFYFLFDKNFRNENNKKSCLFQYKILTSLSVILTYVSEYNRGHVSLLRQDEQSLCHTRDLRASNMDDNETKEIVCQRRFLDSSWFIFLFLTS